MFWSRDYTFYNDKETLEKYRKYLKVLLYIKGRDPKDIQEYLNAYNYFITHPSEFDGATIVKDLVDFGELDLDAMLHDYEYITGSNRNIVKKFKSDLKYIKNMEKNGKGIRVVRFILLTIAGIGTIPYSYFKHLLKIKTS
jgi:hypothetical protein